MSRLVYTKLIFLWALLFSSLPSYSQTYNQEIEAKFDIEFNDEFIKIVASALNKTKIDQSLRYVMSGFVRMEDGTTVKEEKTERFVLPSAEKVNLNTLTLQRRDIKRKIILILIYDQNDKIIGKDRVVFNDETGEDPDRFVFRDKYGTGSVSIEDEPDGITIRGLVVENTKTKPARDFYKEYSDLYILKNINAKEVITIDELLALGSNTKVEVKVGGELVWQFFVNPRSDYITQMAEIALNRTIRYLERKKRNKNLIKKY